MGIARVTGTQIIGGVVLLGCLWLGYELFLSPLRAYPGPFAAKFTDLWRAYLTYLGNVDEDQRRWHRQWGSAVRIGPRTISVNDPDLIKAIYASTDKNAWLKSDMYKPNDVVVNGQRISNIFNTSDKAFHAKYTKPIGGFWTLSKVLELEPLMDETLTVFTNKLRAKFADVPNAGKVAKMDDWVAYFAWDSVANVTFGRHYGFIEQEKDVEGMINESTNGLYYFSAISQIPWLDNWLDKNPIYRIGPKPLVNGFLYTMRTLAQYQQDLANGGIVGPRGIETFMERYNGLKDMCPDFVDDNQVVNWLMLNVLAGGDSTAGAMRSVIYHLGRNPSKYQKLVDELKVARLPLPAQWKDIRQLTYLDAAINEALRVTPSLGLVLERDVPEGGFRLPDGRFVPAGSKIGINPAVVTRDTGVFGSNVDDYDPDRWLQRDSEADEDYKVRRRRMQETTDFMFGAGNRVCMGKHMAKLEIYKLFATLYSMFDIQLKDPNREWESRNAWFMYQRDIQMTISHRNRD